MKLLQVFGIPSRFPSRIAANFFFKFIVLIGLLMVINYVIVSKLYKIYSLNKDFVIRNIVLDKFLEKGR